MPTVVDTLLIKLELDPSNFSRAQKQAADAFIKTRDEGVKQAKEVEEASKKTAEAVAKVSREVLGLFAVFIGGKGLKEWLAGVTESTGELVKASFALRGSPEILYAMGSVLEQLGGKASGAYQAVRSLSDQLAGISLGMDAPILQPIRQLFGFVGKSYDAETIKKTPEQQILDISDTAKLYAKKFGDEATYLILRKIVSDPEQARAMMLPDYRQRVEAARKLAPTKEDREAFEELQKAFVTFRQEIDNIGTSITTGLSKPMKEVLDDWGKWLEAHKEAIAEHISDAFKELGEGFKAIKEDIKAAWEVIKPVWLEMDKFIKENLGGWQVALEVLVGIRLASWAMNMIGLLNPVVRAIFLSIIAYQLYRLAAGNIRVIRKGDPPSTAPGATKLDPGESAFSQAFKDLGNWWSSKVPKRADIPRGHEMGGAFPPGVDPFFGGFHRKGRGPLGGGDDDNKYQMEESIFKGALRALRDYDIGSGAFGDGRGGASAGGGAGTGGLRKGHSAADVRGGVATGGNRGVGKWWTPERKAYAIDYLIKNGGLSEAGASGLVARWAAVEAPGGPSSVNPGKDHASGVGQWLGVRKFGFTVGDLDSQLAKTVTEFKTTEARAYKALRDAKTAGEAARGASMFERAEHYNPATGIDDYTNKTPSQQMLDFYRKQKGTSPQSSLGAGETARIASGSSRTINNQITREVSIGTLEVNTPATDADGIAGSIKPAINRELSTGVG